MVTQECSAREAGRASALAAVLLGVLGLALVVAGASRPGGSAGADAGPGMAVVMTTRAVAAGAVIVADDVITERMPSAPAVTAALIHSVADAEGHRAAVSLPPGVPLIGALLLGRTAPVAGHRLVRLPVDSGALPPGIQADQVVDVVAALGDPQATGGGRLVPVASGRVVSVARGADSAVAAPSSPAAVTLTLDVDVAGAQRLLWAESFAKSLHVLARPLPDDGDAPAEVDGLPAGAGTGRAP